MQPPAGPDQGVFGMGFEPPRATVGMPRLLALVVMLFAAAKVANAQESLRVGYFDLTPHVVQVEGKEPSGAAVGYFEEFIAPVLGIEIIWDKEVTPPTRLMDQLRTGEKDAMIFLGWTKDRTAYLHYPDPYLTLPEVMVFRADHPIGQVVTVEDLHGLRVGFLVGGSPPGPSHNLRPDRG
jgi:ABC-type amino acid transport substrate-binding protein